MIIVEYVLVVDFDSILADESEATESKWLLH